MKPLIKVRINGEIIDMITELTISGNMSSVITRMEGTTDWVTNPNDLSKSRRLTFSKEQFDIVNISAEEGVCYMDVTSKPPLNMSEGEHITDSKEIEKFWDSL